MNKPLEKEFQYYIDNQDKIVEEYNGRYVAIKNGEVIGDFSNELEAIEETSKTHTLGTFLVQRCEPGTESYTQTFHSRVSFV